MTLLPPHRQDRLSSGVSFHHSHPSVHQISEILGLCENKMDVFSKVTHRLADEALHCSPYIRPPRRTRMAVKRMQRERKSAEGMMLQTDASPHDWLEGPAPEMDLLGTI